MKKLVIFGLLIFLFIYGINIFSNNLKKNDTFKENIDGVDEIKKLSRIQSIKIMIKEFETQIILNEEKNGEITDINYISYSGEKPKSISIIVENGKIKNGTFTYEDDMYYYDGKEVSLN